VLTISGKFSKPALQARLCGVLIPPRFSALVPRNQVRFRFRRQRSRLVASTLRRVSFTAGIVQLHPINPTHSRLGLRNHRSS